MTVEYHINRSCLFIKLWYFIMWHGIHLLHIYRAVIFIRVCVRVDGCRCVFSVLFSPSQFLHRQPAISRAINEIMCWIWCVIYVTHIWYSTYIDLSIYLWFRIKFFSSSFTIFSFACTFTLSLCLSFTFTLTLTPSLSP